MTKSLKELAECVGGKVMGDPETCIHGAADISDAVEGDIVFAESPAFMNKALQSKASAVIARESVCSSDKPIIVVDNPRYAFALVLEQFAPDRKLIPGIHPSAYIHPSAVVGENSHIGFNAYIGAETMIGRNVSIYPLVYIGDRVKIGDDCLVFPLVSIYDDVTIGSRVIMHSGCVIGIDGFGYTLVGSKRYKIPQIGTVIIGNDVEIGANTTIDRARTGQTTIGSGTKLDNMVHIAHNVSIGKDCVIMAQTGIAGSVKVGDRVTITGQAGVKDNITIGDEAILAGRAGVIGNIEAGALVSGYPARPHTEQLKAQVAQLKLPDLMRKVRDLEKRIKALEEHSD